MNIRRWQGRMVLLLGVLSAGCEQPGRPIPPPPQPAEARITVAALNRRADAVDVYAEVDGMRVMIGEVDPGQSTTLELPSMANHASRLLLSAYPMGWAESFTSGPLAVRPGGVIDLVIESPLYRSRATVRPVVTAEPVWPPTY